MDMCQAIDVFFFHMTVPDIRGGGGGGGGGGG